MKKICLFILLFAVSAKLAFSQQELLSFDEHNKYIFYRVADLSGIPADTLHDRGLHFLKTVYVKTVLKLAAPQAVSGESKFLVYGGPSVLRHETGEIAYKLNIEFKDQKYRFWLTDFVFTPYQRDRYGNFVPQPGVDIPLEELTKKMDKKEAAAYLDETGSFCEEWTEKLKTAMTRVEENCDR
jgi:hypothetical protein